MNQRIVVIGGLAAGPSAASKAKRINPDADVTLLEQSEHVSYGICEIPYYIGNVVQDPDNLIVFTPNDLGKEKGICVRTLSVVEEIDPVNKSLAVRDLRKGKIDEVPYDKLIIATGSRPKTLGFPGEDARNVFQIKSLDGAFALKKYIGEEKPAKAVIVGGGYIGMEMAEALVANGIETTILHRSDLPMSGLEAGTKQMVLEELGRQGVRFHPKTQVKRFITDSAGKVYKLETSSGDFSADLVIVAIGVEPNTELALKPRISLGPHGGITTDQRQSTSVDSILAAGDCCEVRNFVNNAWMYAPLATIATRQAWVAGENAAGGTAVFKGALRAIAVKVFDLEVARVGLSSREAQESGFDVVIDSIDAHSRIWFFPNSAKLHVTIVLDKRSRRILGANLIGKDGAVLRANTLSVAIQQRLTIEEISHLDLIYTPPFSPLWDPLLIAANRLKKRK
ncbi:MAG: FAD-dependent oxidoreductase [Ignavibacteriales bacterium]|nr:FAD-dependent oxidoreductase [Ignavibacteriales bacterium]